MLALRSAELAEFKGVDVIKERARCANFGSIGWQCANTLFGLVTHWIFLSAVNALTRTARCALSCPNFSFCVRAFCCVKRFISNSPHERAAKRRSRLRGSMCSALRNAR